MLTATRIPVLLKPPPLRQFINSMQRVSRGNLRALWLPQRGHTATTTSPPPSGRVWTYDASIASRISAQGHGVVVSFASVSSQYATTPDTADLSFGNGTVDSPFSGVVLANVTDTAARRPLFAKYISTGLEYRWSIEGTDVAQLDIVDNAQAVAARRASDAAVTQGSLRLHGFSYDGTGGATAANGITLYEDAAVKASTATNNAAYVAMGDRGDALTVGQSSGAGGQYFDGTMGFAAIYAAALTLAQHLAVKAAVNKFYGLSL